MIILNERQKRIIQDLEKNNALLVAKMFAEKYNVSMRTIRSDIIAIADYLNEKGIEFVRLPGQGMQIISKQKISDTFFKSLSDVDFPYLKNDQRSTLLLLKFFFLKNPLSTADFCENFKISKGTIISTIKIANDILADYKLGIIRYQNKGYRLHGNFKNIVKFNEALLRAQGAELMYNTMILPANGLISKDDLVKLQNCLQFISNNLFLYISQHHYLSYMLYCLLCSCRNKQSAVASSFESKDDKLSKLISYIENIFEIQMDKNSSIILKHILNNSTDYSDNSIYDALDVKLPEAINAMIEYVNSSGMYQLSDCENLRIDLTIHLKSTIDAMRSGMPRNNPLLEQIKSSHPKVFDLVKAAAQCFQKKYPLSLDDHEIGYLTLYFLLYFDKAEKLQETRVMVVCNTGRSASKLLATRLINSIPDIHIVSMNSIYNISHNPDLVNNVDFIISTVPLTETTKPHVVISPLLPKNEIAMIKEAIWLSHRTDNNSSSMETAANYVVETYDSYKDADKVAKEDKLKNLKNLLPYDSTLLLGESAMLLFEMISELYPDGLSPNVYNNAAGILAHTLMSIPRWQRSEFIEPFDFQALSQKHKKAYDIIKSYIERQSKLLDILIPDEEIIAILRYFIF